MTKKNARYFTVLEMIAITGRSWLEVIWWTLMIAVAVLVLACASAFASESTNDQWAIGPWYAVGTTVPCKIADRSPAWWISSQRWLGWQTEVEDAVDDAGQLTTVKIHSEAIVFIAHRYRDMHLDLTFYRDQKTCDIASAARAQMLGRVVIPGQSGIIRQ